MTYGYPAEGDTTYTITAYDQDGRAFTETYNSATGMLTSTKDAKNILTQYTYNADTDRLERIERAGQSVEYTYDNFGKLTSILHAGTTYSFLYDIFGNKTSTEVGTRTLANYTYGANNGNLMRLTYGNGNRVDYTYDRFGNFATVAFNGTVVMKNFADSRGDIVRTEDLRTNLEHRVTYDSTGRLISKDTLNLATASHTTDRWLRSMEYDYDLNNNLTRLAYADTNGSNVTTYTYREDNLLENVNLQSGKTLTYNYDKLGRLISSSLPLTSTSTVSTAYTYASSVRGSGYTTNKLSTETVGGKTYRYAYDALGNITRIYSVNGSNETLLHLYTYDNNSQLTADMNPTEGTITDYSYDDGGNILQVKVSAWDRNTSNPVRGTEISRNTYSYTDDEWADLLTSYNGQTITYDAIGNPLNYRDGISLTWQNGRELATYADSAKSVAYSYDASGMRTGKTVTKSSGATTAYTYVYENGLLLQMSRGARFYDFSYDANGRPLSIAYRSQAEATPIYYYYALNSRGDVIGLYNSSGNIAALYDYDAYGKLLSVKTATGISITADTDVAIVNPLRYRSYVYDTETGLYYLQTRYYDPTTCRFVNGDCQLNIDTFTGYNQFSYCENNPTNAIDITGTDAIILYDKAFPSHIGALVECKDGNWYHTFWGAPDYWQIFPILTSFPHNFSGLASVLYTGATPDASNIDLLNEINQSNGPCTGYDDLFYLCGDYSSCLETLSNPSNSYNLLTNNCSQLTLGTLSQVNNVNTPFLDVAKDMIIPASAFNYINNNAISWNVFANNKTRDAGYWQKVLTVKEKRL